MPKVIFSYLTYSINRIWSHVLLGPRRRLLQANGAKSRYIHDIENVLMTNFRQLKSAVSRGSKKFKNTIFSSVVED